MFENEFTQQVFNSNDLKTVLKSQLKIFNFHIEKLSEKFNDNNQTNLIQFVINELNQITSKIGKNQNQIYSD